MPTLAETHQSAFTDTWTDATPIPDVRFIVLDTETTGLDPKRDSIITIGAVAMRNNEILLDDSFEALLSITHNLASVTVHGITRDQTRDGMTEPEALEAFLPYLADGVIVGHHIGHDIHMLDAACERHFGFQLQNRSLDTMDLTLHLEKDGAFADREQIHSFTLDTLCHLFNIEPHDRHTAGGDAFLTALVFQRLLRLARKFGRETLGSIATPFTVDT